MCVFEIVEKGRKVVKKGRERGREREWERGSERGEKFEKEKFETEQFRNRNRIKWLKFFLIDWSSSRF